jgi:uncharacterized protein (TIRG00374 family)
MEEESGPDPALVRTATRWSVVAPWLRRGFTLLVFLAVLDYLVLPQIAGTRRALDLLGQVNPWWLALGVALEAASLISYSLLTRSVIPDSRVNFSWVFRSDLTGLGVSHLVPGGAATANTLRYRLLHRGGAASEDAVVGLAVEAAGSTAVLAALLWTALVVSIPFFGPNTAYVSAAIVGALIIAGGMIGLVRHQRQPASSPQALHRVIALLPRRFRPRVQQAAGLAADQLRQLLADRGALRAAAGWAVASWVFDAASLWVFLVAYGHPVNLVGLLVAYSLANLLGSLPISPGGLGVVEGILVPSLVGFGAPRAAAVLAVVSWRLFEFWAPIPVAGLCYLSLRRRAG